MAGVQYYLHTYWQDYRLGNYGGNFKPGLQHYVNGVLSRRNTIHVSGFQTGPIAVINYGSTGVTLNERGIHMAITILLLLPFSCSSKIFTFSS